MKTIDSIAEIQNDAIVFGNEANLSRAIPYIADGLKPSQRAVIFGAYDQGYNSTKPHVKSLKLDGFITGTLWPHGSEYSTIVRLTQPFVMNIPLLDMHGSNGSQLGTPDAAASRYTEVRLSKACEDGFLKTLDKNTCEMIPNYSEDKLWPKLFPGIIPNLFVNGSDGMGYCYSQTWLPGNLNEFYNKVKDYLENKKLTFDDIFPDFPTKGIIINKKDIHTIYETGQGTIILRGRAYIENNSIIITELPYQIYVSDFMDQLKGLITPDKNNNIKISGVANIYNMSGDTGMHIEIECEEDPKTILNKLYRYSNLQINLSANQYGIIDGLPELINLEKYIKVYVDHNLACLQREYKYDLDKATTRKEIVDGLIKAISIIDKVIDTIKKSKSSDDARQELINKFNFTENQAKAIIDMRLGKLANLEQEELNKELAELSKTIENCTKFLASDKLQKKEFINRLTDFVNKYGWERRTEVTDVDLEVEKAEAKVKMPKIAEYFNLVLENNYLKKLNSDSIKKYLKINPEAKYITLANDEKLILISNKGTMYKLPVKKFDACSPNATGNDLSQFIDEKIIAIYSGKEEDKFLFMITKYGLAKKILNETVFSLSKNAGAPIMRLDSDDEIIDCRCITSEQIIINNGKKDKVISTDDFLDKGRSAGGVSAVKPAAGFNEIKIKAGN